MSTREDGRTSELRRSAQERLEPRPRSLNELIRARTEGAGEAEEALRLAEEQWGRDEATTFYTPRAAHPARRTCASH